VVKTLFVIEDSGTPISSYVLAFYPVTRMAALFDVPPDTGLIIKSLGRTDAISALFKSKDPKAYRNEISRLMAMEIPLYVSMDLDGLEKIVDLLDGLEIFVPNPIELLDQDPVVLFPQGNNVFDGSKVRSFVTSRTRWKAGPNSCRGSNGNS
jgi:anionic cell wall polymer biosynthesis LytR-Cps2A-Psr (LCP) family protein